MLTAAVDRLHDQVTAIDTAGPRGMAVLAMRVEQLSSQLTEHEREHTEATRQRRNQAWALAGVLAVLVAPIYPILLALR